MGQRKSKLSANSYDIAPVADSDFTYKKGGPTSSKAAARSATNQPLTVPFVPAAKLQSLEVAKVDEKKPDETQVAAQPNLIPEWLSGEYFVDLLKKDVAGFKKIVNFKAFPALNPGENYATLMLRVAIDVEVEGNATKTVSYMLKLAHNNEQSKQMDSFMSIFATEKSMYLDVLPEMESLYKDAGKQVSLGPKHYDFVKQPDCDTVLLEDLRPRGFKNANRFEGLDLEHTKLVLQKLAILHAGSAHRIATKGRYADLLMDRIISKTELASAFIIPALNTFKESLLANLKNFRDCERFAEPLVNYFDKLKQTFDSVVELSKKQEGFWVLTHGDCWANNIMFTYTKDGNVDEAIFVDFQCSHYNRPSQDLYYFLLSSVNLDIKLSKFDYFIRFYHEQLIENLVLLKYPKSLPTLRDLHMQILTDNVIPVMASVMLLPVVLLDPTEHANMENLMGNSKASGEFQKLLFTNPRYIRHIQEILPWLYNRGALEVSEPEEPKSIDIKSNVEPEEPSPIAVATKATSAKEEWLNADTFSDIIKESLGPYKSIKNFNVNAATASGDNYSSELLKIDIDVEMDDGSFNNISYMLKLPPQGQQAVAIMNLLNTFNKEALLYNEYLPKFEQLCRDNGLEIVFGPRSFKLSKDIGCQSIVMENLRTKGFKNCDRLVGLDDEHTEAVLKKLAEFHAASASYYVANGRFNAALAHSHHTEENREFFEKMGPTHFKPLVDTIQTYNDHEQYSQKIVNFFDNMFEILLRSDVADESKFNVLNHGDCWSNNIMFQYDANTGSIANTYFVDFQLSRFGSPALDLYYFLLSSTKYENKLNKFDHYVRIYHEHLVKTLQLLKYPKHIPTLQEMHVDLLNYGSHALYTVSTVLTAVLLDPVENANIDSMMADKDFRNLMYTNARYRRHLEAILPWLNQRGLLDFEDYLPAKIETTPQTNSNVPSWVDAEHFEDTVAANVEGFSKILKISAESATKAGDNYASSLLKVDVSVELKDGSTKSVSYMLKIPPASEQTKLILALWNLFPKEKLMYSEILPAFEKMYKDAGLEVVFGPKSYSLDKPDIGETILMENLRQYGYKNGDRLIGLDLEHTKCTLRKIAQLHAASARYVEVNGPLPEIFNDGLYTEKSRPIFEHSRKNALPMYLECVKEYQGCDAFYDKIVNLATNQIDKCIELNKIDPNEFNVLNHGDSWLNNVMFQHDESGNITDTLYVDFQVCKYGSPVQDLYYFLMTSTQLDIKVKEFDNLIKYYHDNLVENLQILKYNGKVPTLEDLQGLLKKYGFFAYATLASTLTICLLDPTEASSIEAMSADSEEGNKLRQLLFSNDRYKAHASTILQWLNSKGLLDF